MIPFVTADLRPPFDWVAEKRGTRSRLAFMATNAGAVDLPEDILRNVRQWL